MFPERLLIEVTTSRKLQQIHRSTTPSTTAEFSIICGCFARPYSHFALFKAEQTTNLFKMVKLEELEDEHFINKPVGSKDDALLVDDDEDYTDTGMMNWHAQTLHHLTLSHFLGLIPMAVSLPIHFSLYTFTQESINPNPSTTPLASRSLIHCLPISRSLNPPNPHRPHRTNASTLCLLQTPKSPPPATRTS